MPTLQLAVTGDGSHTLWNPAVGDHYHSRHGAVQEALHVFIAAGLDALPPGPVRVLEVGFGTGLNALLTLLWSERTERALSYTTLEPLPIPEELVERIDHAEKCGAPQHADSLRALLRAEPGVGMEPVTGFRFQVLRTHVQELEAEAAFDLIFFDAFGPTAQPDMWTSAVFARMYRALRPGGLLVTYCAKGDVRRTMQAEGFVVERLPGPPGKREMIRAQRPSA